MKDSKRDLEKILRYAKSHGIRICIKQRKKGDDDAAWIYFKSKSIHIRYKPGESIKSICMSLLHELSHLLCYILNKKSFNEYFRVLGVEKPSKTERYLLYQKEREDISKMPDLVKILRLKSLSENYVRYNVNYDIWNYQFYFYKGRYPRYSERKEMQKRLKVKWGLTRGT